MKNTPESSTDYSNGNEPENIEKIGIKLGWWYTSAIIKSAVPAQCQVYPLRLTYASSA